MSAGRRPASRRRRRRPWRSSARCRQRCRSRRAEAERRVALDAAVEQRHSAGIRTSASTIARSSTISQPTAMRPRSVVEQAAFLQRAQQHDGARDRQRQAEHDARRRSTSPSRPRAPCRAASRQPICTMRAGNRDRADRQQVLQREMQADAEHQQDDADFGEFVGERLIGDEARREGARRRCPRADSRPAAKGAAAGRSSRARTPAPGR